MMEFTTFIPKRKAEEYHDIVGVQDRVLISITTPGNKKPGSMYCCPAILHEDTWKDILRLEFHDVDPNQMNDEEANGYKLFNESHVVKIMEFLKKHELDTKDVIVHCEAGISRSAGVSKFISVIYSLAFPETYSVYNKHVFSTLMRVYGESFYGHGILPLESLPGLQGATP